MAQALKPTHYYLESDGQIFLVRKKGLWSFPNAIAELPCKFTPLFNIPIEKHLILFAKPSLTNHPDHWFHKDAVAWMAGVDPVVQRAVNISLARGTAKAAIIENGQILMVKGSRGITQGMWNLPGGFMGYGEHPSASVIREVREELGLRIRLARLLGVYSEVFPRTGGYMLSFVYLAERLSKTIRPDPTEIADFTWMPVRRALRETKNPFVKAGLRDYLRQSR